MPIYRITLITALLAMLGAYGLALGLFASGADGAQEYSDFRGAMDGASR